MTLRLNIVAALMLLCIACSNVKETPKGLTYTVIRKGDGIKAKPGEYLVATLLFKDSKDSVWFDNRKSEFPAPILIPDTSAIKNEDSIGELFRMLTKGDSVTFDITAQTLFEKTFRQQLPPKLAKDPQSKFTFQIGVSNVIGAQEYATIQKAANEKEMAKMQKLTAEQMGKDTVSIDSVLQLKKITPLKTTSGLRYVIEKKGNGPYPTRGQVVKADYAGYLLNGKLFDTSIESIGKENGLRKPSYGPFELPAGAGKFMRGFDEALLLMNKGEKMRVYIPSPLMYGPQRVSADIAENSILVFDITMLDIK